MIPCRVLGHRHRFIADGPVVRWSCQRGCGAGGEKTYRSDQDAARYARAFDRDDVRELGRRAPYIGLFPLRIWHWWRLRRGERRNVST